MYKLEFGLPKFNMYRRLLAGVLADLFGISWAIDVIGGVTFLSGVVVSMLMRETLPSHRKAPGAPLHDVS